MRTTAGSALAVLLTAGALAAPAGAATMDAPGSVAPHEVVALTVDGIAGGPWAAYLVTDDFAGRLCERMIAVRTPVAGRPTVFSGTVPATVECPSGGIPGEPSAAAPPPPPAPHDPEPPTQPGGPQPVEPGGGYRLAVFCAASDPGRCEGSAARRGVTIVPAGERCAGARRLRARNVPCAVARRVARRARGGDRRYRKAGLRCRGTFDPAGDGATVYRCTRTGARVTFVTG